ncbi:hypothetical protein OBBRIDRAFT_790055 [Obba rivulosa]|uniref:Uncharacterized protein n=1 Tax=Obba rivulosa TaxID=1052685 RepID=A0A8E2DQ95_9APHY|nr:hypothetical protein OBBRIDRAFT_790055 [Obba rivulosa]
MSNIGIFMALVDAWQYAAFWTRFTLGWLFENVILLRIHEFYRGRIASRDPRRLCETEIPNAYEAFVKEYAILAGFPAAAVTVVSVIPQSSVAVASNEITMPLCLGTVLFTIFSSSSALCYYHHMLLVTDIPRRRRWLENIQKGKLLCKPEQVLAVPAAGVAWSWLLMVVCMVSTMYPAQRSGAADDPHRLLVRSVILVGLFMLGSLHLVASLLLLRKLYVPRVNHLA